MNEENRHLGDLQPGAASSPSLGHCWSRQQCIDACAGVLSEPETLRLVEHASSCDRCAIMLRDATRSSWTAPTPEEAALLAALPSSSGAGLERLAQQMQGAIVPAQVAIRASAPGSDFQLPRVRPVSLWRHWRMLPIGLAAAACVAVFAVSGMGWLQRTHEDRLLAEAYNAARPSEMRIPGSLPGDVSSRTRGAGASPSVSAPLLELKLDLQHRFDRQPDNPEVRQRLGRIALLEHNPSEALQDFEIAQAIDPHLHRLSFDLGTAYLERAETSGSQLDNDKAINFFSQYLNAEDPKDPVALFDRALAWQQKGVLAQAIRDLQSALAHEKDSAWRTAIQQRIDALRKELPPDQAELTGSLTPARLLASPGDQPGDYERYLDAAMRDWLPHRTSAGDATDATTARALAALAAMGQRHGDRWLTDMLARPASPTEAQAEAELAQALVAYDKGDSDATATHAAAAAQLFRTAGNPAGEVRAQLQHVYSLQSTGKAQPCLAEAEPLSHSSAIALYSRVKVATLLELSSCFIMSGDGNRAVETAAAAVDLSRQWALPIVGLRAAGFLMSDEFARGRMEAALRTGSDALRSTSAMNGVAVQRFQVLEDMKEVAHRSGLHWTTLGLSEEGARVAQGSGNARVVAYALEDLATSQVEAGQTSAAQQSFAAADRSLTQLPAGPAANLYRADWQTDRALWIDRTQGLSAARAAMATAEPQFARIASTTPRVRFYTEYADILRASGDRDGAMKRIWQAMETTEAALGQLSTTSARIGWLGRNRRTYDVLVEVLNDSGRPAQALCAWRWYSSAAYAPASERLTSAHLQLASAPDPRTASRLAGTRLTYARLQDRYILWVERPGAPVEAHPLALDAEAIDDLAATYAQLCGDPNSTSADRDAIGSRLAQVLLDPARDTIAHAGPIELEVDGSLQGLPFAALPTRSGYLGLEHSLSYAQAAIQPASAIPDADPLPLRNIVLLRGISGATNALPSEYDETRTLARQFTSARLEGVELVQGSQGLALSGSASLPETLSSAVILHYSGHGLGEAGNDLAGNDPSSAEPSGSAPSSGEASLMPLVPGSLPHCRLAVLAACRTLGKREDDVDRVSSVAGTLLNAGAANVLATQWDVDSRATQQLMLALYAQLSGQHPLDASLQSAMATVAHTPQTAHPYYWAAFQAVHRSPNPAFRS